MHLILQVKLPQKNVLRCIKVRVFDCMCMYNNLFIDISLYSLQSNTVYYHSACTQMSSSRDRITCCSLCEQGQQNTMGITWLLEFAVYRLRSKHFSVQRQIALKKFYNT